MQRYNDEKVNTLFSVVSQVRITTILLSVVVLGSKIFTNCHPHSPFEFVWCLKPCSCQLYKEGKNIISFAKEPMIQQEAGGVQVNRLTGQLWSSCTGKKISVRECFSFTLVLTASAEQCSAELCLILEQSSPMPQESAGEQLAAPWPYKGHRSNL